MKCKNGFTLVELLVVIAIISLLVSILLPSLQKAKALAKETQCLSILRNLGLATQLYANDNDGHIPTSYSMYLSATEVPWWLRLVPYLDEGKGQWNQWSGEHADYIRIWDDYACPEANDELPRGTWDTKATYAIHQAAHWGALPPYDRGYVHGCGLGRYDTNVNEAHISRKYDEITSPSDVLLYTDIYSRGGYIIPELYLLRETGGTLELYMPARHSGEYAAVFCGGNAGRISEIILSDPYTTIWTVVK